MTVAVMTVAVMTVAVMTVAVMTVIPVTQDAVVGVKHMIGGAVIVGHFSSRAWARCSRERSSSSLTWASSRR